MGRKLERFKQHLGLEHETKGFAAERTQRLGDAVAARVERGKVTAPPALDDHDTRGTDGVQP